MPFPQAHGHHNYQRHTAEEQGRQKDQAQTAQQGGIGDGNNGHPAIFCGLEVDGLLFPRQIINIRLGAVQLPQLDLLIEDFDILRQFAPLVFQWGTGIEKISAGVAEKAGAPLWQRLSIVLKAEIFRENVKGNDIV